jgi:transketolase
VKVVKQSENDSICIVACGVPVHEALKAAETLSAEGVHVRVLDIFSVKPIDAEGLKANIEATNGKVIVAEEHYPEGGLYEAVCGAALGSIKSIKHLCVKKVPGSAKPQEQLEIHGLDSVSIEKAVR